MDSGGDKGFIAAKFHNTIARAVHQMALGLRKRFRLNRVALSGGVFTNRFLRERSSEMLEGSGFDVYQHRAIAAGDGGIPAGQVAIANACRGQRAFAMNKGRIRCA
jgi:hydrogenase maturation protein HypF